ncbi:GyrI-like domain-containing protein [Flavobacterium sp. 20NA77.7]|uniref:GyrI-like domain-containing protein n=1 Tax=Flavobacterium nakdongensis TaxID=3073563 RepID=A0ABY9RA65_9FLAO|nr:GyrI-like domain-containing protein [Flavobacterium sp. 20NA77.7]WMW77230.1 GyrI-like domain-containing protein [Flavobacterium sp. 20NA77.7]
MLPKIIEQPAKKLIGFYIEMSLVENKTQEIWKQLMPRLNEVQQVVSADLFSLQIYPEDYFSNFTPFTPFTKWAAVEVKNFDTIPEGFQKIEIPAGKYAVFLHKGTTEMFVQTAQYIYGEWLPKSGYQLENRPHFEVLGDAYLGHENPDSEEEVWIPII